jgi:uncharacterized protein with FMN-binding domain
MKKKINKIVMASLIPFAFFMMTSFGGSKSPSYPEGWNLTERPLADGVYKGVAAGYQEGLTVEVTVTRGTVSEIIVTDHNEMGRQYYKRAIDLIPGKIIEEQKTDVDGVTGATFTSMGIMSAVEDALKQAQK